MQFGPTISPVLIVLGSPTQKDIDQNEPFQDLVGYTFKKILEEASLEPHNCLTTYVVRTPYSARSLATQWTVKKTKVDREKYPASLYAAHCTEEFRAGADALFELIKETKPKVILAVGEAPLLSLLGQTSTATWRGSELPLTVGGHTSVVIPIYDASSIITNWLLREVTIHDVQKRVVQKLSTGWTPSPLTLTIEPSFEECLALLDGLTTGAWCAVDIETVRFHDIDCIGFASSPTEGFCIPLLHKDGTNYWPAEQHRALVEKIRETLNRLRVIGQNFNYDAQYLWVRFGIWCVAEWDTLSAQHVMFPGTPKALDYLASLYCDHYVYWKDENKNWTGKEKVDDRQRWTYNVTDCLRTFEVATEQMKLVSAMGMEPQLAIQRKTDLACFKTMLRGIPINKDMRHVLNGETKAAIKAREERLNEIAGHEVNPRSPLQVKALFSELGLKLPTKMGKVSTDKEAMEKLLDKGGVAGELAALLIEIRSLGTLNRNVIEAKLDPDGKFHTSLNGCGTETFRLSSSQTAFKTGGNAQNITDGSRAKTDMPIPNLRKLYVPLPGFTIWECDQERADVQVVAWEARDDLLKQMFREHADLHTENAKALFGLSGTPTKPQRDKGKTFVHLTNYGGKARTCAVKCGMLVAEAEKAQKRWFEMHPGIKEWHRRIESELRSRRYITNAFGFRRYYFDRLDGLLGQALAWIPQSTVALVDNMAWHFLEELELPELQVFLQVHDSLMGIYETSKEGILLPLIHEAFLSVVVPYEDPLIIGADIKTSEVSWGDCKPLEGERLERWESAKAK